MTNFEKIKAMTVEEMADLIGLKISCEDCPLFNSCDENIFRTCTEKLQEWLESEVSNEKKWN